MSITNNTTLVQLAFGNLLMTLPETEAELLEPLTDDFSMSLLRGLDLPMPGHDSGKAFGNLVAYLTSRDHPFPKRAASMLLDLNVGFVRQRPGTSLNQGLTPTEVSQFMSPIPEHSGRNPMPKHSFLGGSALKREGIEVVVLPSTLDEALKTVGTPHKPLKSLNADFEGLDPIEAAMDRGREVRSQLAQPEPVVINLDDFVPEEEPAMEERLELVADASGGEVAESLVLLARVWVKESVRRDVDTKAVAAQQGRLKALLLHTILNDDRRALNALLEAGFEWAYDSTKGLASLVYKSSTLVARKEEDLVFTAEVSPGDEATTDDLNLFYVYVDNDHGYWCGKDSTKNYYFGFDFDKWNYADVQVVVEDVKARVVWVGNQLMLEPVFLKGYHKRVEDIIIPANKVAELLETRALIVTEREYVDY